jgi:ankyrin repeat protein
MDRGNRTACRSSAEPVHWNGSELLEYGAKVGAKDRYGNTALQVVTLLGRESAIQLLLDNHVDLLEKNNDGRTPKGALAHKNLRIRKESEVAF